MVQVGDRDEEGRAVRQRHGHAVGRPLVAEVQALQPVGRERRPDEEAVAVLGAPRPAPVDRVVVRRSRREQAVLLHRVDDLLEAQQVGTQGGRVGQQQREALLPAVRQVQDVERRDAQAGHPRPPAGNGAPGSIVGYRSFTYVFPYI